MPRVKRRGKTRSGFGAAHADFLAHGIGCCGDPFDGDEAAMRSAWGDPAIRDMAERCADRWNHSRRVLWDLDVHHESHPARGRSAILRCWAWYQFDAPDPKPTIHLHGTFGRLVLFDDDPPQGEYEYLVCIDEASADELRVAAALTPLPNLELAFAAEQFGFHRRHCTRARADGECGHGFPASGSAAPGADLEWRARYPDDPWNLLRLGEPKHD